MAFKDLREYIALLEEKKDLRRITVPVSSDLEISQIADRVVKSNGPALLFENVEGYDMPLVINLFGSRRRIEWALGVNDLEDLGDKVRKLLGLLDGPPPGLVDKVKTIGQLMGINKAQPKIVSKAPCQEEVFIGDAVDLGTIPALKCWPSDAGRFITLPLVISRDPETGRRNVGTYRMQIYDSRTTGMHWQTHKVGARHFRSGEEKNLDRLDVAVALGGDPVTVWAGSLPVPPDMDEIVVSGIIRGDSVHMVRCKTVDLEVPAHSEIVLEGYVDPEVEVPEGPFGDWCGSYTESGRRRPKCDIVSVYHRNDPIILGFPPQSLPDEYSRFRSITRSALLRRAVNAAGVPDVKALWCHEVGGSHMLTGVSITQRYPGHSTQAAQIASQCQSGAYAGKWVIVTDDDVDVADLEELIWAALMRCDPVSDIDFIKYGWTSFADPRIDPDERAKGNITNSRMIIDACRPFHWKEDFNKSTKPSEALLKLAREKFGYLLE